MLLTQDHSSSHQVTEYSLSEDCLIIVWGLISGYSLLSHWPICLFLCQDLAVLITAALQYSLKPRRVVPSALFFPRIVLAIQGRLYFHTYFTCICPGSVKNVISVLIGVALVILTTLLLPVPKPQFIFSAICVVLSFSHQHPTVLKVQVFCLLTWSLSLGILFFLMWW